MKIIYILYVRIMYGFCKKKEGKKKDATLLLEQISNL